MKFLEAPLKLMGAAKEKVAVVPDQIFGRRK